MTSSAKPEVHNELHCRQTRPNRWPRVTCREDLVKFGRVVIDIRQRTDRHAHRNTSHLFRGRSNESERLSADWGSYLPAAQKSFRTDVVDSVRLVLSRSATSPPSTMTIHIIENVRQHSRPFCIRSTHQIEDQIAGRYARISITLRINYMHIHYHVKYSAPNPTSVVSILPPGLPPRTFAWTVSSELLGFWFYLFFPFFRFWAVR